MNSPVAIHKATLGDSRDIWTWRNDLQTRAMSITTAEISWESHSAWFQRSLLDENRYLYVGYLAAQARKIGMCRFDVDPDKDLAEVSITLNPAVRGLGISHQLLSAAVMAFLAERPANLAATIKKQNIASIKCFTRCGFSLHSRGSEYFYYRRPAAS